MLKVVILLTALLCTSVYGIDNAASYKLELNTTSSGPETHRERLAIGSLINKQALQSPDARTLITYRLGGRLPGDQLVAYTLQTNSWAYPTNVALTINYPKSGTGGIVTYVEILVNQSNPSGEAYVTQGGIGQRFIEIVVEAEDTLWFNYEVNIYAIV